MKFTEFIGIDVSKSTIDVFIYGKKQYRRFANLKSGLNQLIEWVKSQAECPVGNIMFAFEHTGLYSVPLSLYLDKGVYSFVVIPGLELKRSLGISRGKSDKTDARRIAEYAYEKKDKLKCHQMPSETILQLKRLASYRERLVKERTAFKCRIGEYKVFLNEDENSVLFDSHRKMIAGLNEQINIIEKQIKKIIKQDEKLNEMYDLIISIKGVGPQTALMMIVLTNGFISFESWRKFSSYSGIAPFPNESGKYKGKTQTNSLANKRIKALLNQCATSAIQYNAEMRIYYQDRVNQGKNKMSTLNNVRNKLLSRIFAVVERGTPYVETYKYAT